MDRRDLPPSGGGRVEVAERGAALVIALLLMGLLLLLGTAFMTISSTESQIAFNERNAIQAFYLAEAGLNKTISDLNAGAVCSSLRDVSLGSGTFTRTVNLGATLDQRIVEAFGYVPNSTSPTRAQAKVKVTLRGPLFSMALFAQGTDPTGDPELDIGESSQVDSYDSSRGAYNPSAPGTKAEIGSNGNIRLKSGARVECRAVARGTIAKQSGAVVTGVETSFSNPVTLPSVSFMFSSGSNVTVGNNDTVPLNPGNYGKLDVGEKGTIVLSGGTYSFYKDGSDFSIKMAKEAKLKICPAGQVKIYINGKINVDKDAEINISKFDNSACTLPSKPPPGLPTNLLIYSSFKRTEGSERGVSFDKELKFYGAIYAPDTDITTQKDSEIYGSLIGRSINLAQDNKVHFDAALRKTSPCDITPGSSPCPYKPQDKDWQPVGGTWQEVLPSS